MQAIRPIYQRFLFFIYLVYFVYLCKRPRNLEAMCCSRLRGLDE